MVTKQDIQTIFSKVDINKVYSENKKLIDKFLVWRDIKVILTFKNKDIKIRNNIVYYNNSLVKLRNNEDGTVKLLLGKFVKQRYKGTFKERVFGCCVVNVKIKLNIDIIKHKKKKSKEKKKIDLFSF